MKANERQEGGNHYKEMVVQPWQVIDSLPIEQAVGFYRGNAIKYLMRMGHKGKAIEDLKKARHYMDKLHEVLE